MKFIQILSGSLILLFLILLSVVFFTKCQTAPELQQGELYPCFAARDCDFRNQKNPEKCVDQWKECRSRERYVYCKDADNRWKDCKEQECWDKLNGK